MFSPDISAWVRSKEGSCSRTSSSFGFAALVLVATLLASCAAVGGVFSSEPSGRDVLSSNGDCRKMMGSGGDVLDSFALQVVNSSREVDIVGRYVSSAFRASTDAQLSDAWLVSAREVVALDNRERLQRHLMLLERFAEDAGACAAALEGAKDDGCAGLANALLAASLAVSVSTSDDVLEEFLTFSMNRITPSTGLELDSLSRTVALRKSLLKSAEELLRVSRTLLANCGS